MEIDWKSTRALLSAFENASTQQLQARNTVEGCRAALGHAWGGQAAALYGQSLAEWLEGLEQVRAALGSLADDMQGFANETRSTEDDNIVQSSWFK